MRIQPLPEVDPLGVTAGDRRRGTGSPRLYNPLRTGADGGLLVVENAESKSRPRADAPRVLVADDEDAVRLLLRVNLPMAGYEVVEAHDGTSALERARAEAFDLLLLDVMMPGLSGIEVAERLRADPSIPDVPIVFVSARADVADIERGFEAGAVDYVTKPFDPIELTQHLGDVLEAVESGTAGRFQSARLGGTAA